MSTGIVAVVVVAGVLGLAVVATRRILSHETDPALRRRQLLLCWLVPLAGPVLALAAHRAAVSGREPELDYQRSSLNESADD